MKPLYLFLTIALTVNILNCQVWTQQTNYPANISNGLVGFGTETNGYIGLDLTTPEFWEYNTSLSTWTRIKDFPGTPSMHGVGFSIGNKGYAGTGLSLGKDPFISQFYEYNPQTDNWKKTASFAGMGRSEAVGFSMNGKAYLGLGWNDSGYLKDFWEYDPVADSWRRRADFPGGYRAGATGFSVNGMGYVGLGYDSMGVNDDIWEYNPKTNTWTQKGNFPGGARSRATNFVIHNNCYLGCGSGNSSILSDVWKYDAVNDAWDQIPGFGSTGRIFAVGFSIGCMGYLGAGGGTDSPYYTGFFEFDPGKTVLPDPIGMKAEDTLICYGRSTNLSALGSGTLYWYKNASDGPYIGTGNTIRTERLYHTTTFYVHDSGTCALSASIPIKVTVLPEINTEVSFIHDTLFAGEKGASYQWIDCYTNGIIQGAVSRYYFPGKTGIFKVIVARGICKDTSDCLDIKSSIIEEGSTNLFSLYPNPTTGKLSILTDEDFSFKVIGIDGKVVTDGNNVKEMTLDKGIYTVSITIKGVTSHRKVVVL